MSRRRCDRTARTDWYGHTCIQAKPEIVEDTVRLVRTIDPKMIILCGAGITKGEDVAAALRLGTKGVLVASGVVRSRNQFEALDDLVKNAKNGKE